jgi:ribosomal protein S18 acetylase RimI-like enzyme
VEAQLLLFDSGQLSPVFKGFEVFPRLFLERELHPLSLAGTAPRFPEVFELVAWTPHLYDAVAQMIHAAYQGQIDSGINDQYRTLAGVQRFLHNIIRFPGCGTFDPESSWVLRERRSGALVGTLLCSRVAVGVAHLTQLCVAPEFRAQGLGAKLLDFATQRLATRGYQALTLTVSEGNKNAVALYLGNGFRVRHRFDALVKTIAKRPAFRLSNFPSG